MNQTAIRRLCCQVAWLMLTCLVIGNCIACDGGKGVSKLQVMEAVGVSLEDGTSDICKTVPPSLCSTMESVIGLLRQKEGACLVVARHNPLEDSLYSFLQYRLFSEEVFAHSYGPWEPADLENTQGVYDSAHAISADSGRVFKDTLFNQTYDTVKDSLISFVDTFRELMSNNSSILKMHIIGSGHLVWSLYADGTPRDETALASFFDFFLIHLATPSFVQACISHLDSTNAVCIRLMENETIELFYPIFVNGHLRCEIVVVFAM